MGKVLGSLGLLGAGCCARVRARLALVPLAWTELLAPSCLCVGQSDRDLVLPFFLMRGAARPWHLGLAECQPASVADHWACNSVSPPCPTRS